MPTRLSSYKGAEVGLSVEKHFVEIQGGTISVGGIEAKGSIFTIDTP